MQITVIMTRAAGVSMRCIENDVLIIAQKPSIKTSSRSYWLTELISGFQKNQTLQAQANLFWSWKHNIRVCNVLNITCEVSSVILLFMAAWSDAILGCWCQFVQVEKHQWELFG